MKICLECADGGHLDEMLSLMDAFVNHEVFFITFDTKMTSELHEIGKTLFVPNFKGIIDPAKLPPILKDFYCIVYLLRNTFRCFNLLRNERPDMVISTGGPVTIPLFIFARVFNKKTIYIESLTRVETLSGTGRVIYYISDVFLVQWKSLLEKYENAEYWGNLI